MSTSAESIDRAVEVLRRGGLVAIPTETVYGLGADASNDAAVRRIFDAKGRPADHPLIVHVASAAALDDWSARRDPRVAALADAFWPGPLTVIVPRSDRVADAVTGGRTTVGLRVPDHPLTLDLLERFGGGVAAPSANRFGRISPTTARHVIDDLGDAVDLVLDGGPCRVGVESTIVEVVGPEVVLLRPGGVSVEQLADVLGGPVVDGRTGESRASGMLESHYAPQAPVTLARGDDPALTELGDSVAVIGPATGVGRRFRVLPAEAAGFAAGLYDALRAADRSGATHIVVVPPDHGPLLPAVLDRLAKAAAPRP